MHKLDEKALAAGVRAFQEARGSYEGAIAAAVATYLASLPSPEQSAAQQPATEAVEEKELIQALWGALNFILAFYDPGQNYLDTNAWKCAEASGRRAHKAARDYLDRAALSQSPSKPAGGSTDENH